MKKYLPLIGALLAMLVGLLLLSRGGKAVLRDDAPPKTNEPTALSQAASIDVPNIHHDAPLLPSNRLRNATEHGTKLAQTIKHRDELPAPNTRPFNSIEEIVELTDVQSLDQSETLATEPIPSSDQATRWPVAQTSFLAPIPPQPPVTTQPPRDESILVMDTLPVTPFNAFEEELNRDRLTQESKSQVFDRDLDEMSDDLETPIDELETPDEDMGELPDDGSLDDIDDIDLDDEYEGIDDDDLADIDLEENNLGSNVQPPWVPNEAEQIGTLLDQISNHRITNAANAIRWSLDDAIAASLAYSNRVSSLRIESTEALQNVGIEYGQFDVAAFVTQSFRDSEEPVGSSIDTASGVQPTVNQNDLNIAYGLRQQLRTGGDFEISQSYQFLDNDSGILIPEEQAISRLNGRLTKELLRGAGRSIAMNQVLVAHHDASAQRAESVAGIADHLNEVMTAYWDIFAARGALFASMGNREMAIEVRRELTARQDIDAEPNLIDQSEATIRQRELQMNQAHSDLVKAQIRFISLVNAPELLNNSNNIEILPQVVPDLDYRDLDVDSRVNTAIQRRPEIGDVIEQIKSAQVANHLSLNELLPRLALSLEAGLNGLEGDSQLGDAISNQFDNDVTYQVGVDFEVPLANRRARFNKRRTELVVARLRSDWQDLIQQVKADVLDNAQEFQASQQRLDTQRQVLKFTANELRYLGLRKTVAPKETDNVSFALTQVLSAQDRQGEAKSDFIAAIADKYRAIFELNRATGILINSDVIPQEGGPGRPGCFSVYHHYLEERGSFEGPLAEVENATRAKSNEFKGQSGIRSLNLDSYQSFEAPEVIQTGAEFPTVTSPIRYPLSSH